MMLCCATAILAQNNRISYQAVVRDTANRLVANKTVTVTVEIFNGDAQTAAYTETQTTQTNYNGLIALQIGNGNDWASIDWKTARIETTVKLEGTELATLEMPLTAVPYALYAEYADELDPGATVVTNIYDKMRSDSLALGTLIDANTAEIGNLKIADANLDHRIVADSNKLVNFKAKMKTDSTTLRNLIDANAAEIVNLKTADASLSQRIVADSNNLVNFKAKMKTDSTTLRNLIDANTENITITDNHLTALQNRVNTFNTHVCDSVDACVKKIVSDTASALRGLIKATDDKFVNYYTKTQTDINIHDTANTVREEMSAQLATKADANNVYTKAEVNDLLAQLVQSLPKMDQETFTVANDGQTTFTLNHAPKSDYIYRMYINGVMVGGSNTQVLTISSTATKTMQYDASKNGNYALKANDKVTIVYWY